jgi:integrase
MFGAVATNNFLPAGRDKQTKGHIMKQSKKLKKESFKALILALLKERIKQNRHRNPVAYDPVLNGLWKVLGPEAQLPADQQKVASFERVHANILDSGLAESSARFHAVLLRTILREAIPHGLNPGCITALSNSQHRAPRESVVSLQKSHLKTILEHLQFQLETLRLLIWIALSGGSQIVDAVLLRFSHVDWNTGIISYPRTKTGQVVEFAALPPLMELLSQRRARLGPQAVFVMPELVFAEDELKSPNCNTTRLEEVPLNVAMRAAAKGMNLVSSFLKSCGLKEQGLTYKSFRSHQISFLAAAGIQRATRMRMCGHSQEELHKRFEKPLESEILNARNITWKYLQAVQEDRPFSLPATAYDVQECLNNLPDTIRDAIRADLSGLHNSLEKSCSAVFSEIKTEHDGLMKALRLLLEECRDVIAANQQRRAA